jgi:hypothetical protein
MMDIGWNASTILNLSGYVGGEYGFSTGALITRSQKIVFSDIARTTVFFGLQATGRWFNVVGGIQKEWEYIDFQSTEMSDRALRYYLGANVYIRRYVGEKHARREGCMHLLESLAGLLRSV